MMILLAEHTLAAKPNYGLLAWRDIANFGVTIIITVPIAILLGVLIVRGARAIGHKPQQAEGWIKGPLWTLTLMFLLMDLFLWNLIAMSYGRFNVADKFVWAIRHVYVTDRGSLLRNWIIFAVMVVVPLILFVLNIVSMCIRSGEYAVSSPFEQNEPGTQTMTLSPTAAEVQPVPVTQTMPMGQAAPATQTTPMSQAAPVVQPMPVAQGPYPPQDPYTAQQ